MSSYTPNLDLLKKDPVSDLSQAFNVGTMMNDNWDKIDAFVALVAASIAPAYSSSSSYAVGAWCTHGGKLWQCATAIGTGGEAWNESHWTAVTAAQLIAAVSAAVEGKAPTSHAASADTYGKGTGTSYGHLKLSDATDDSSDADGGIAATPKAVKAVENTKADKTALATFVRPNILGNWYFVGGGSQQGGGQLPINQRGQTSYSGNGNYSIDLWAIGNPITVTVNSAYLTIANADSSVRRNFTQTIENPAKLYGKKLCSSILLSNGSLYSGTVTIPSSPPGSTQYINIANFGTNSSLRITFASSGTIAVDIMVGASESIQVAALKMELGTTQTLAHQENGVWVLNEIPDYNEQVIRCTELPASPAKVEYGSYTGTGTYGSTNANSLTLPFVPKFLLVKQEASSAYSIVAANGLTSVYSDYSTTYSNTMTWSDTTVTWYSTSAQRQLNTSATVYYYVAVG